MDKRTPEPTQHLINQQINKIGGVNPPLWLCITAIIAGAFFLTLQFTVYGQGSKSMDGYSYFNAWETLKTFHPDMLRPPLYAIFTGIFYEIAGEKGALIIIPILQWGAYIASLWLVWTICGWLRISKGISIGVILSFLLLPGMWLLNNLSVPEPLCGCGMILLVWLSGRYLQSHRSIYLKWSVVLLLALVFTKSMFIFLLPVLTIFWGYSCRKNKRHLVTAFGGITLTIAMLAVYALCMKSCYAAAGLTQASSWNRYYSLRMEGLIIPDEIDDISIRERFRPFYEKDPGRYTPGENLYWNEIWSFNWSEMDYLIDNTVRHHPDETLHALLMQFPRTLPFSQFRYVEPGPDPAANPELKWNGIDRLRDGHYIFPLHDYLWFPIWVGWAITLLFSIFWIARWIKRDSFPALPFLIAATTVTGFVTIIIGAPDDWGRLMTPLDYLLPIMAGSTLSIILKNISCHSRNLPLCHSKGLPEGTIAPQDMEERPNR